MEAHIKKARENLLSDKYGKYDLIEELFSKEVLINKKPRLLKQEICSMLELDADIFNYQTFHSWLSRYRKNASKNTVIFKTAEVDKNKEHGPDDWHNFKVTEPIKQQTEAGDILRQVTS